MNAEMRIGYTRGRVDLTNSLTCTLLVKSPSLRRTFIALGGSFPASVKPFFGIPYATWWQTTAVVLGNGQKEAPAKAIFTAARQHDSKVMSFERMNPSCSRVFVRKRSL